LHYQEILEMAIEGARVIHPRAVERAMADDVRIVITSLANSDTPPTEIGPRSGIGKGEGVIRAITHISEVTQYRFSLEPTKMAALLDKIAAAGIELDLVNLGDTGHSLTVASKDAKAMGKILEEGKVSALRREDCSKISLIGAGIRGVSKLINRIYKPLMEGNIPVYHTSDSYTQIALLVPQEKLKEAVNRLHEVFFGEGSTS